MTLAVIPDVNKLVSDYLKAHEDIRALHLKGVAPAYAGRAPFPSLTVTRVAGSQITDVHRAMGVLVQVDAWAATGQDAQAWIIAATAQSVLRDRAFVGVHGSAIVTGTRTELDVHDVPDPQKRARKSFDIRVFVHPVP